MTDSGLPIPRRTETGQILVEDIFRGEKRHCQNCPVARAAARIWQDKLVVASMDSVYLYELQDCMVEESGFVVGPDPRNVEVWDHDARDFIERFDTDYYVGPRDVTFRLVEIRA